MNGGTSRHITIEPIALTISQAAELGGPCRSILYEDIRSGRLRAVKRGRSTRILVDDFRKYMAALPAIPSKTVAPIANAKARRRTKRRGAA